MPRNPAAGIPAGAKALAVYFFQMKKSDFLWLLAVPIYVLLGTIRHEGSHALMAWWEGASITKFVFWPSWGLGTFQWGYITYDGTTGWLTLAAPYFCDALIFIVAAILLSKIVFPHWAALNIFIIGMVSPFVNSAYQYVRGIMGVGDVANLLVALPLWVINAYFLVTLAVYVLVGWRVFRLYVE